MPNMIIKKMGRTRAASAISEPEVPVAIFFSLSTFHSLLHARGRARLHTHPQTSHCHFELSRETCFSLAKQQVPRLRSILRRAEDGTSLGMTGAWRFGIVQAQSLCKSPGLPACV